MNVTSRQMLLAGLGLRLCALALFTPWLYSTWFLPFLQHSLSTAAFDPWSAWLQSGGDALAFPYGPLHMAAFLPFTAAGTAVDHWGGTQLFACLGLGTTVLLLDYGNLRCLQRLMPDHPRRVLLAYWLSPLVLYINYWHGQLDVLPVFLLLLALVFVSQRKFVEAGGIGGLAVASKFSLMLAVPFLLIYLIGNKRLRPYLVPFVAVALVALVAGLGACLYSPGLRQMMLGTPEAAKIYDVAISLGQSHQQIYVLPIIYLLTVFAAWRTRRMSFPLLTAFIGLGFFLLLMLTPASPGWFLWVVPFIVLTLCSGRLTDWCLYALWVAVFLVYHLLQSSGAAVLWLSLPALAQGGVGEAMPEGVLSWCLTLLVAVSLMIAVRMIRDHVLQNDQFRLNKKPLLIGIAGDSGAGKDTLATALTQLFGSHSTVSLAGDDYHLWDRNKPMWQVVTHLQPRANDLHQYYQDILALASGRAVRNRHYDHKIGRMGKQRLVKSNDVIIANGLHALASPMVTSQYDLKIFLAMDERLRRHYKIQRDVYDRGYDRAAVLAALDRRSADSERYIKPQQAIADMVLAVCPAVTLDDKAEFRVVPTRLHVTLRSGWHYETVVRALIGLATLQVDVQGDYGDMTLMIDGEVSADDLAAIAENTIPNCEELTDLRPLWQNGTLGLMQLLTLTFAAQALRRRLA